MRFLLPVLLLIAQVSAQNFDQLTVERIATGLVFAEGPAWSREGFLVFSDVPENKLLQFKLGEKTSVLRENSNGAMGNAFDAQGRLYSCETHSRRVTRLDKRGKVEVFAERYQGKQFNAPNDIVIRKDGQVFFTDPAFGNQEDTRDLDFFGVYHVSPRGEVDLIAKPKGRPNGIALSPNGRILYVSNSDEHNIRAYDLDSRGSASNERVLVGGIAGIPDGLRTDEKGNLYLAAGKIEVYTPEGKPLGSIALPETPSNCAFGDDDLQSLYVTARTSVYRVRLDVKGSVQY
ncbi:MAG TPA: SMP-30/gluconolactonase/LRE family protein [Bryobacteraceae bacterium]|nr:SMP-30/gluconolactonase/LRE family protein [Bryobacteraceae bacterium]